MDLVTVDTNNNINKYKTAEAINLEKVKNIVEKKQHPNPLIVVGIVFVVILVMYYFYISLFKINHSGKWYDTKNEKEINISHNIWSDDIVITDDGNNHIIDGFVNGGAVYLLSAGNNEEEDGMGTSMEQTTRKSAGVFLKDNKILWADDKTIWEKVNFVV